MSNQTVPGPRPFLDDTVRPDAPWLGLRPFTEETQRYFFGRDAEIREIFLRVRDEPLTVLFAQSGLGKTSLLGAGLVPKLRADGFRPQLLRLRFEPEDPPLLDQVRHALAEACVPAGDDWRSVTRDLIARWGSASLWEVAHHSGLLPAGLSAAPPVLIVDQCEELFTLGAGTARGEQSEQLAAQLADLIENRPPAALHARLREGDAAAEAFDFAPPPLRVVLSLREDYLSHLEAWKVFFPSLMRNRMALHPLRGLQAHEAVVRPGRLEGRDLVDDGVGAQIVCRTARVPVGTPLETIEAVPPLLSLLCDELNRARGSEPRITAALVDARYGDILQDFYTRSFEGLPPAVRRLVEDRLVTVGGHRTPIAREDAEAELRRMAVDAPARVIDSLIEWRLLSAEERGGIQRLELTHDVLAPLVVEGRDKRQERERAEKAEADRRVAEARAADEARARRRLVRLAAAALVAAAVAVAGMVFAFIEARRVEQALSQTTAERSRAQEAQAALLFERAATFLEAGKRSDAVAMLAAATRLSPQTRYSDRLMSLFTQRGFPVPLSTFHAKAAWLSVSPDGTRVVVAGTDNAARVWELSTGAAVTPPMPHAAQVNSARFSADGMRIVTASDDKTARVWDARTGAPTTAPLKHDEEVNAAAFSPDGSQLLTVSSRGTVRVWDAHTGKSLLTEQGTVLEAAFAADNKTIDTVTFAGQISTLRSDSMGILNSLLGNGPSFRTLKAPMADVPCDGSVNTAAFSPDHHHVVLACDDGASRVWEVATGKFEAEFKRPSDVNVSVAWSQDNWRVVTVLSDKTARVWNANTGEALLAPISQEVALSDGVFSTDGAHVITASPEDGSVHVWDVRPLTPVTITLQHKDFINAAAFSPDGARLVTASDDHTARLWDARTGAPIGEPLAHNGEVVSAAFSPDGARIATASYDKTVRQWDAATGRPIGDPLAFGRAVFSAIFSPTGTRLATNGEGGVGRVWDPRTGALVLELPGARGFYIPSDPTEFRPDGLQFVAVSRDDGRAQILETDTGKAIGAPFAQQAPINTAVFSPDGRRLVTTSDDGTARVWDAETGAPQALLPHGKRVRSAVFSPDGTRIVTASEDQTARIWDSKTGALAAEPLVHASAVFSARFSRDGSRVLTISEEGLRIWDTRTGKPLIDPQKRDAGLVGRADGFNPEGTRLFITDADNSQARLWDLGLGLAHPPDWFPRLLEALAGRRLDDQVTPAAVPDAAAEIAEIARTQLGAKDSADSFVLWARRFLHLDRR